MAKSTVYENKKDKIRIRDKKVGNKTTSYVTHGDKAGPKGFRRKAKVVDKKLPTGARSTTLYGSKKTMHEAGPMAAGKPLRREMKAAKQSAKSITINGNKYDTTRNRRANPNLKRGGSVKKKKMKRGGRSK